MHRKVAGESLHEVNAIDAIKIAGSDIVARVRYHTEDTLMYILSSAQIFTFLFQSSNHSILLLGRSRYEETANFSEERGCGQSEGGQDGVANYIETVKSNVCLFKVRLLHNFHGTVCPLRDNCMKKIHEIKRFSMRKMVVYRI